MESHLKTNTMSLIRQLLLVKRRQWHQQGGFVAQPLVLQREKSFSRFHSFAQISVRPGRGRKRLELWHN